MERQAGDEAPRPSKNYKSAFENWDKASWVRAKPHQFVSFDPDLQFFSEALPVLFSHSVVRSLPGEVKRQLLALHLYVYLEFTVWLEMGPVNEVCELLRRDDFLPWLPVEMKTDAFKIYVDEGGHAEMSHTLIRAVEHETGLSRLRLSPAFLDALDRIVMREEQDLMPLIKLFFVIISETLITGTLVNLPKDETVQVAVRALAADHASDEGRHHSYFRGVFDYLWPRLPVEMKLKIGTLLPEMIMAFLQPDRRALLRMLQLFPSVIHAPEQLVDETLAAPEVLEGIRQSSAPTLKMLGDNRVFELSAIRDAFEKYRLLPALSQ